MTALLPLTADSIPDAWFATVRGIASRHEGSVLRPHPTLPRWQSRPTSAHQWNDQLLYSSVVDFASRDEMMRAWDKLWKV